ncbi:hypothetical protein V6N13_140630 [Hibiscus sabdariffa]|uniref:Uncharacterized protein n=2 Tax=Hibiscus sabdariffa TaxID=183260 RepID=A0ABR2BL76_9ROSI
MANPRRNSYSTSQSSDSSSFQFQTQSSSSLVLLKKPHAFPFLVLLLLLLAMAMAMAWVSLRLQYSSSGVRRQQLGQDGLGDEDSKANLVRFKSGSPSPIVKDNRGWLLDPVSLALHSGVKGGAVSCLRVHLGEIRHGGMRGNHRHYACNETFVIWGARTKFRLENKMVDRGYAEVTVEEDEVVVAASPSGTAHALVNVDASRSTFFLGCQDGMVNTNNSNTDFNVWKDL